MLDDIRQALDTGTTTIPTRRSVTARLIARDECDQLPVSIKQGWLSNNFPLAATLEPKSQFAAAWLGSTSSSAHPLRTIADPTFGGSAAASLAQLDGMAQTVGADLQTLDNFFTKARSAARFTSPLIVRRLRM